jgi:lipopolysaccharide transport system permease protein
MAPDPIAEPRWTENHPPSRGSLSQDLLREVWERRELVFSLALRDFKLRYTQALLGVSWVVLQPLATAALFYGIFGRVLHAPSDGIPYLPFAFLGLAAWSYISQAVVLASESLAQHSELITRVYFPRLAAPTAAVLPSLVDFGVALLVLVILLPVAGVSPDLSVLTLPLWIAGAVLLAFSAGLWLAALNAQFRDVRHAVGFFLQFWFFASPIAYSSSVASGGWRYVYSLNPVTGLVDGLRWSLLSAPAPGGEDLLSLIVTLLLLASGIRYFKMVERRLADVI